MNRFARLLLSGVLGGTSGASFSPLALTGLVAWYDFSDATTMYTTSALTTNVSSDGDRIGGVTDKSGNGHTIIQATSSRRTVYKTGIQNSLSVSRHNSIASNEFLRTEATDIQCCDATTGAISLFAVFSRTGGSTALTGPIGLDSASGLRLAILGVTSVSSVVNMNKWDTVAGNWNSDTESYSGTGWVILSGVSAGGDTTVQLWKNATSSDPTSIADTESRTASRISVGVSCNSCPSVNYLTGDIGEVVIYNRALSTSERESVETYLNDKWAVYV